eukprot:scaffold195_cov118-Skeletonema_dohrnii-CCMP3373.AAC.15
MLRNERGEGAFAFHSTGFFPRKASDYFNELTRPQTRHHWPHTTAKRAGMQFFATDVRPLKTVHSRLAYWMITKPIQSLLRCYQEYPHPK